MTAWALGISGRKGFELKAELIWFQQIVREDAVGPVLAAFVFGRDKPGVGLGFD